MRKKEADKTITGIWKDITIVCGCHERPVKMIIQEGPSSLFYSCPRYYPENRNENESACANRINLIDYEEMVNHISTLIVNAQQEDEQLNLEGFRFKNEKGDIEFRIIEHKNNSIIVSMVSKKALR